MNVNPKHGYSWKFSQEIGFSILNDESTTHNLMLKVDLYILFFFFFYKSKLYGYCRHVNIQLTILRH